MTYDEIILQGAAETAARQAERENEFLATLSADERSLFDDARRNGSSFGAAAGAVANLRQRRAREAAKLAASKPQPRKPSVLETSRRIADEAIRRQAAKTAARHAELSATKPATRKVPESACLLRGGPFDLLASSSQSSSGSTGAQTTAKILARSGRAIEHWYWGRLVNDFSGMEKVKDRLPLDYCHDSGEILGYAENWKVEANDLRCVGVLLADKSARAAEVVSLAKSGVPYEASISFTPIAVEELRPGASALVNGQTVEGPASIVRRWRLTGLAVCPRGADPFTKSELSAKGKEVEVSLVR